MNDNVLILDSDMSNSLAFLSYYYSLSYKIFIGSDHHFPISLFSKVPTIKYRHPASGYLTNYGKSKLVKKNQLNLFISSLENFVRKNKIRNIISLSERSLIPLSQNIKKLGVKSLYAKHETINQLHDKGLLIKLLKMQHIKSFRIPSVYSMKELKYPCVVRPTKGMGSFHVYTCKSVNDVKNAVRILKIYGRTPLIQQFILSGTKFAPNMLVNKRGKVVRMLSSSIIKSRKIIKVVKELEQFFKKIRYFGFASPQFLVDNGIPYITEINPRLSTNWYGLDFGVGFPESFHKLFIENEDIKKKFKFIHTFPSMLKSSKIFLEQTGDMISVIKSLEAFYKDSILRIITR